MRPDNDSDRDLLRLRLLRSPGDVALGAPPAVGEIAPSEVAPAPASSPSRSVKAGPSEPVLLQCGGSS
jgi:hypothetical protein